MTPQPSQARHIFWMTFNAMKPFRWSVVGLFFVSIFWSIDVSLRPYLIKLMVDQIQLSAGSGVISNALVWPALFYIAAGLTVLLSFRLYDWLWLNLSPRLKKEFTLRLVDHLLKQSNHFYQMQRAGDLSNKINDVIYGIPELVKIMVDRFFGNSLALLLAVFTVSQTSLYFAGGLVVWLTLLLSSALFLSRTARQLSANVAEVRSSLSGQILDVLSNIMNVRLFSNHPLELGLLDKRLEHAVHAEQTRDRFFMNMYAIQGGSFVLFEAMCLGLLAWGFGQGWVTAGDFVLILNINTTIIGCLWNLIDDIQSFSKIMGQVSQGLRLLEAPLTLKDSPQATRLQVEKGSIQFDNVLFHYSGVEPLFQNKSVTLEAGEKVGLVGSSGSGKTTFANLILRLYDVSEGQILIDGQDIKKVTQASLRENIGCIPQNPQFFHRTIADNIRYARPNATFEEVKLAAQKAHAHDFIMQQPLGYDSWVGENALQLSGGQRQRLALARAILKNAPILILDEATSQLDTHTEHLLEPLLWELMQNKTTLVIAHRLSTLLRMDRILVFHQGKIVGDGPHHMLVTQNSYYQEFWRHQQTSAEDVTV